MSLESASTGAEKIPLALLIRELEEAFNRVNASVSIDVTRRELSAVHKVRSSIFDIRAALMTIMESGEAEVPTTTVARCIRTVSTPTGALAVLTEIAQRLELPSLVRVCNPKGVWRLENQRALIPHMSFKMNGAEFLERILYQRLTQKRDFDTLAAFDKKMLSAFGPDAAGAAELLSILLDDDTKIVGQIITSQTRQRREEPETANAEANFLQHFLGFVGMYADVSQHIVARCERQGITFDRTLKTLERLLRDPVLRRFQEVTDESEHNMYGVLQAALSSEHAEQNPWVSADLTPTPFASNRLGLMMERSVPRQVLAPVLVELNDHHQLTALREAQISVAEYDRLSRIQPAQQNVRARIVRSLNALGAPHQADAEISALVSMLERHIENLDDPMGLTQTEEGAAVAEHLLLRTVDPEKVVGRQTYEQEVGRLLERIATYRAQNRSPILARSLQILLKDDSPSMDVPIQSFGRKGRSLREILLQMSKNLFGDDVLHQGPAALAHRHALPASPLFTCRDAEQIITSSGPLSKNFNTAAVGPERGMLLDAGRRYVDIHSYAQAQHFVELAVRRHLKIDKQSSGTCPYELTLHPGATEAFRAFVQQRLRDWGEGDHAIISNQEYGHMTDVLRGVSHQAPGGHVKAISLNDRSDGRSLNSDELFRECRDRYESGRTKLLILSEVTRFGDRPCATGNAERSNAELAKFIAAVRAEMGIPVVIDGSQAVGRTESFNLVQCSPDVYIGSGSKALGTGSGAFMATRQQSTGRPFSHEPSTLPIANLVAMGIALDQSHRNHDFTRMEGNFGSSRGRSHEQRISEHMSLLTSTAITAAGQHGQKVLDRLRAGERAHWEVMNQTGLPLQDCLSCRVIYPVHRNVYDYAGILVVDFPNMQAETMARYLRDEGFQTLPCLEKSRALRISFHYLHSQEDIQALFVAMADAHAKRLGERMRGASSVLNAQFDMPPG